MGINCTIIRLKSLEVEKSFHAAQSILLLQAIVNAITGLFFFAHKSRLFSLGKNVNNVVIVINFMTTTLCIVAFASRATMVLFLEKRRREISNCEKKENGTEESFGGKKAQNKSVITLDKMGSLFSRSSGYLLLTVAAVVTTAKILSTCLMFTFGFRNVPRIYIAGVDLLKLLSLLGNIALYSAIFSVSSSFFISTRNSDKKDVGYRKKMYNTCLLIAYGVVVLLGNLLSHLEKAKTVELIVVSDNCAFAISDALFTMSLCMFVLFAYNTLTFMKEKCESISEEIMRDSSLFSEEIVVEELSSLHELRDNKKG
ncbi:MAG: hypothetical protein AB8U44_00075 [Aaplasma endosymbiont of Hyalomma asiaticum]